MSFKTNFHLAGKELQASYIITAFQGEKAPLSLFNLLLLRATDFFSRSPITSAENMPKLGRPVIQFGVYFVRKRRFVQLRQACQKVVFFRLRASFFQQILNSELYPFKLK